MRGIKIPQQDFALKSQGELMCEGGVFAGHYGTSHTEVRQTKSFYITHLGVCTLQAQLFICIPELVHVYLSDWNSVTIQLQLVHDFYS